MKPLTRHYNSLSASIKAPPPTPLYAEVQHSSAMHILQDSSSKSSTRPATNRHDAMRQAIATPKMEKVLNVEQQLCSICICKGSSVYVLYRYIYII